MIEFESGDFEYVVPERRLARLCFGSTLQRPSLCLAHFGSPAPNSYDPCQGAFPLLIKKCSLQGYGGLALKFPRDTFKDPGNPGPGQYWQEPKLFGKQSARPFNVGTSRFDLPKKATVPGPGVYSPEKSTKRFFKRKHNFGGRSHLLGSVQIRCLPEQMDTCAICGTKLVGDYWFDKKKKQFMCHQYQSQSTPSSHIPHMEQLQKVRECTSIHKHESSTQILLLDMKEIKRLAQIESYLSLYFE